MSASRIGRAAMILVAAATPSLAQDSTGCGCVFREPRPASEFERRSAGSFSVIQSRPTGALGNNIGLGYGANASYLFRLDRTGVLSLRMDVGFLQYGDERKRVMLSPTVGGRIQVDLSTSNNIVPLTIGPQLTWPSGAVRPYVNGGVGGQFFFTESHLEGVSDSHDFANTTNQWDKTMAWVAGGGVYVPVYERGVKVMIDAGAQFVNGGRARYLKPGSIQDLPNGEIRITPMETETRMVLVRLGVRIGM